jgi:hypothetical protein
MSDPDAPPHVVQFRQILLWPIQLVPHAQGERVQGQWELLEWLSGGHWTEVAGDGEYAMRWWSVPGRTLDGAIPSEPSAPTNWGRIPTRMQPSLTCPVGAAIVIGAPTDGTMPAAATAMRTCEAIMRVSMSLLGSQPAVGLVDLLQDRPAPACSGSPAAWTKGGHMAPTNPAWTSCEPVPTSSCPLPRGCRRPTTGPSRRLPSNVRVAAVSRAT